MSFEFRFCGGLGVAVVLAVGRQSVAATAGIPSEAKTAGDRSHQRFSVAAVVSCVCVFVASSPDCCCRLSLRGDRLE